MQRSNVKLKFKKDTQFSGGYSSQVYQTLYFAYRPFLFRCIFFILFGVLGRFLLLSNANITGLWVDSLCPNSHCDTANLDMFSPLSIQFFYLLIAATALGFICTSTFRVGFSRLSARAVSQLHDEVVLRTSRYPMSFFDVTPVGRVVTRFSSDYGNVFRLFGGPLAEFISIIADLTCMVVLTTIASPYYLPWILLAILFNFFVYRYNRDSMRKERRILSSLRSPSIAHFAETVQGASSIRAFLKSHSFSSRFSRLNDEYLNQKLKTVFSILGFSFQMSAVTASLLLLTGLTSYKLIQNGMGTVGSMAVAFSFVVLSSNTVQMFFDWLAQFEEAMTGIERLDEYIRRGVEQGAYVPSTSKFPVGPIEPSNISRAIQKRPCADVEFRDLQFRYRPELPMVLKGVSFKVPKGERWGIVGRTGGGKSSLIQALFYLYPADKGFVAIDNQIPRGFTDLEIADFKQVDLRDYRKLISYISQDSVLFQGTLRENLDLSGSRREDEILQALDKVEMLDWYRKLPNGLQSEILEKGKNLSSGEKQLLCMARCILQDAPLIVMDEATSFVDPQSEEAISKATEFALAGRTQLIIAHRLSTLETCDGIIWLSDGQIYKMGPTREILPLYREGDHGLQA